jgi:NAD(P)-dependent dehydrogenase (short-subunit alcohol dehydrogenase family)
MTIRLDGQVAIVTGAGTGLGRSHAHALAARGAKVVVNDLGSGVGGPGSLSGAAQEVAVEIEAAGGKAIAIEANVADFRQIQGMVSETLDVWGRVDILINNAGNLRDKSFAKMTPEDFQAVIDVHLTGSFNCTRNVWDVMREQQYGRIVMTTSSSGLYGNFGQANYGAAKMALIGLMNTLTLEGRKHDIRVNALGPGAMTQMTEGLIPEDIARLLRVEPVSQAMIALCQPDAPSNCILNAQVGSYSVSRLVESAGMWLPESEQTAEGIVENWDQIADPQNEQAMANISEHMTKMLALASKAEHAG